MMFFTKKCIYNKSIILNIIIIYLFLCTPLKAQIKFFEGSYEQAFQQALDTERPIFVDAFAKWCGPCKRMAATTFIDPEVGELMNNNFVNLKLDMETPDGMKFEQKYPVSAYPTLYFLKKSGEIIKRSVGAMDKAKFIIAVNKILEDVEKPEDLGAKFKAGARDFDFLKKYITVLKSKNQNYLEAFSIAISDETITKEQKNELAWLSLNQIDSKVYDYFTTNRLQLIAKYTEEKYKEKIISASKVTLQNAIRFREESLLNLVIDAINKELHKTEKDKLIYEIKKDYYVNCLQDNKILETAENYYKNLKSIDDKNNIIKELTKYPFKDETHTNKIIKLSKNLAKKNNLEGYKLYIIMLNKYGHKDKAIKELNTLKQLYIKGKKSTDDLENLIS